MSDHDTAPTDDDIDLSALTSAASDTFSVRRVFGPAYEEDGAVIIPVAVVTGAHGRAGAGGRGRVSDGHPGCHHHHAGASDDAGEAVGEESPHTSTGDLAQGGAQARDTTEGRARSGKPWGHGRGSRSDHGHRGGQARGHGQAGAGGFGTHTRPVGVYVIRDGEVSWQPAFDLNRVILGGQIVGALIGTALAITLPLAWALRRRG
ncbi:hypothetical protein [Cellulomonas sp. NPDC089187]|uniref:hypothetical protein n=1 Tax=Cellulomonas sp. NPDC089187 TaxID=3154970 RepID=UPI003420F893